MSCKKPQKGATPDPSPIRMTSSEWSEGSLKLYCHKWISVWTPLYLFLWPVICFFIFALVPSSGEKADRVETNLRETTQALLSLREFKGSHNVKLQAKAFLEVVEEYDLRGKVGYFTMDNHDTNHTMLDDIAKEIDGLNPVAG
ncbi:hypothetical protein B0J15DRAFT_473070 [Fusarium solani]|uniref:Uncharacterized protein n=1 Tax=Fusarium solani TaxID=169388 RepID=A0A9P9G144_FUSSL|nr:uncharacterized protein B0J15DRAFT_473070 [Fusarium solani]KAH7230343.1 hypothetical protein B0J15DRAFT_473070 [Fusarium solani]